MWKGTMDKAAMDKLIDKKYGLKKEKAKYLVGTCAALNGILTKEQREKVKDLRKEHMMGKKGMKKD